MVCSLCLSSKSPNFDQPLLKIRYCRRKKIGENAMNLGLHEELHRENDPYLLQKQLTTLSKIACKKPCNAHSLIVGTVKVYFLGDKAAE